MAMAMLNATQQQRCRDMDNNLLLTTFYPFVHGARTGDKV
jgi:hypothetical protein